jgi:long-subunit fatty acid transport protein
VRLFSRVVVCVVLMSAAGGAQAAGYFVGEIGPKATGRGGAFVANPDDPTAMWLNPAGLSNIKGAQVFVNGSLVRLNQQFTRSCRPTCAPYAYQRTYGDTSLSVPVHPRAGPLLEGDEKDRSTLGLGGFGESAGTVRNRGVGRLVPFLSMAFGGDMWGIPGLGIGVAVYGPNTGQVDYPKDGPQRYSVQKSVPLEAFAEAAVAYRFNRYFGLGMGLALERLGTQQLVAISLDKQGTEFRAKDADLNVEAYEDFIPTMMLGFTSNPFDGLHIGGSFIPARTANATGPVNADLVDGSTLNNPDDPDNLGISFDDRNARGRVSFISPAVARLGIQYAFRKWFDVEVAVVREFWSQFQYVRLEVQQLDVSTAVTGNQGFVLPPTVQPKEWNDTWSLRAGGDFHVIPGIVTTRMGAFVEESAIPDRTLDVTVADGRKLGLSVGLTAGYFGFRLTGAFQHIFIEPRTVDDTLNVSNNPLTGIADFGGQTRVSLGTYYQSHDLFMLGVTMDVGEVAWRLKGLANGDRNWWKPAGPQDTTLLNAGSFLQQHSNL